MNDDRTVEDITIYCDLIVNRSGFGTSGSQSATTGALVQAQPFGG
jgi:hypothetical protein